MGKINTFFCGSFLECKYGQGTNKQFKIYLSTASSQLHRVPKDSSGWPKGKQNNSASEVRKMWHGYPLLWSKRSTQSHQVIGSISLAYQFFKFFRQIKIVFFANTNICQRFFCQNCFLPMLRKIKYFLKEKRENLIIQHKSISTLCIYLLIKNLSHSMDLIFNNSLNVVIISNFLIVFPID